MKLIDLGKKYCFPWLPFVAVLMILMSFPLEIIAQRWKMHPAMDTAPVRIVDTPGYSFFQVFQKRHDNTLDTYKTPVTAGFIYLKSDPSKGIFPMSEWTPLNGSSIRCCEYSPEGNFLVLLYLDGGIDIISDNGTVRHNDYLKKKNAPGWTDVNSLTLSGTEIWIATGSGYVVVEGTTGEKLASRDFQKSVTRMARCGSRVMALIDGVLSECSSKSFPGSLSDFLPVSIGGPANPRLFLPMKGDSFIYLADVVSSGSFSLNYASHAGDRWEQRHINDVVLPQAWNNVMISNPYEKNLIRNKNGWLIFTESDLRQINIDLTPDDDSFMRVFPTLDSSSTTTPRKISIAGSWDFETCWTYCDRGCFSRGSRSNEGFCINDSNPYRPAAPAVAHSTSLIHTPRYGVVGVSYGYGWTFPSLNSVLPPLLSAYKEGVWSRPGGEYNRPVSADANPDLSKLYPASGWFPFCNPNGIALDPSNNDYVWMGSLRGGIAALKLSEPGSDPIHLGSPADPLAAWPGFKAVLPDQSWKGYAAMTTPSFDVEGNLWAAYHDYDEAVAGRDGVRLYWWTRDDRMKTLNTRDMATADFSGWFHIPGSMSNATMRILALKHAVNRNKVLVFCASTYSGVWVFDHNSTLSDRSDDHLEYVSYIEDQHGGKWPVTQAYLMEEDPASGRVWLSNYKTLTCFDPTSEVVDGTVKGGVIDVRGGDYRGNIFSQVKVYGIAFDSANRMWLTTEGNGVWGLSADRSEVVAHYTTENSLLPSDTAYGIVWNPDNSSLMISTAEGYAELWPDLGGGIVSQGDRVSVSPREVMPGYSGTLTVKGLSARSLVEIFNRDHNVVASLRCSSNGIAEWDFKDSSGNDVANGLYTVSGDFGSVTVAVMR